MPWTSIAFVIGGLSLIGVPGTAGFISKWVLIDAALKLGWWPVAILIVASSLLAVIYVWRVVEILYMREPLSRTDIGEAPLSMLLPTWLLAAACVYFGLDASLTMSAGTKAAESLLLGGL